METYRISDVARETGFTPATLRYYESIGLLRPPARTANGYRRYDERSLARLRFIGRARQLGCTLDEIAELVRGWDGEACGPVQDELRTVVVGRIADTQARIAELIRSTGELQQAAAALGGPHAAGPCDDDCACVIVGPDHIATAVELDGLDPAIACTLAPEAQGDRLDEWQRINARVARRFPLGEGVRLEFAAAAPLTELLAFAVAEQACCTFFRFGITVDERGFGFEVQAPGRGAEVVAALFGAAAA